MKVEIFSLSIPFITHPPSDWENQWDVQLYVKLSDKESYGWGESLIAGSGIIGAYSSIIRELIKPLIEEKYNIRSPFEFEEVFEKIMFSAGNCGIVTGAISAVEMAMWGLKARKMKIPLYELFGGKIKDYVKVYGSFPRFSKIDDLIKAVEFTVNKGFDFIKLHQPPSTTLEAVKAVRERFKEIKIAVDLNSPFDLSEAKNFADKIARYEVEWIEEPLWPPNDYFALEKLTKVSPVPIAAGENEYTLYGFRKLLESGVSYIQPDVAKIGGISKFLKVLDLASSYGVKVAPHDRPDSSIVSLIYTLNLALTRNEIKIVEYPISDLPKDLFNEPTFEKGYVRPPENIEINNSILNKYSYINRIRVLHFSDLNDKLIKYG
ncbi:mandelate racemase/muconate lactonizing enzyme family protein [Acidianus hospitalis]|uniref:mandelate racemase/muconate lactonizing enzyme family protein n=1 Tax=Acidianus hospitalis TaxID=563177 RepID=UPI00064F6AB4